MQDLEKRIYDYTLEEIMSARFARYSKTIIQDRALPDVRDGLKPVQRRILYAMYRDHNTYDKAYKKSAKTVGNVMGQFHPHGDSSIYEAMVRMSQWWKQNTTYIDMHGNNGSMDGDSPAAMRYTEARLSKISDELLKDIDCDTVTWAPNYDDTLWEPTVLPAKFPNLLVNGATGISAGYATNMPPHNLGEVIDATIKRIDSPNSRLETIMEIIGGPDFPTGGIIEGKKGILEAYQTGRGKIIVKSKINFAKTKGKDQIVITEIPFDVNKASLVRKIDEIRIDKKIDGIAEVRDESDRENPANIVIDLKKDANKDLILNYLLKNTELQISYAFNNVAIVNRRPMTLGLLELLDAYISHLKDVILKRTKFNLELSKKQLHIVEGLIKALSILDEVIKTIRASKNKADAKNNLVKEYAFSEEQAEAIVTLQLYKLTNTDVTELLERSKNLTELINQLKAILNDENKLKGVMKDELRAIKKEYATPRKTEIKDEITEIKIDATSMIPKEDVVVVVTDLGYLKRVSLRSYNKDEETLVKEADYVTGLYQMNTLDTLLLFTNMGNYLYLPVHEIPDLKWKELGKHVSNIVKLKENEKIIGNYPVYNFDDTVVTIFTKNGMVKRSLLENFQVNRYSKPITAIKLKADDEVVKVVVNKASNMLVTTKNGYVLKFLASEVPLTGVKSAGVKAITIKTDEVVSAEVCTDNNYLMVVSDKATLKRVRLDDIKLGTRARKGNLILRQVKTNPYHVLNTYIVDNHDYIVLKTKDDFIKIKVTEIPIMDQLSTGSNVTKAKIIDSFVYQELTKPKAEESVEIIEPDLTKDDISLQKIDEQMTIIDDFLDDFEL